MRTVDPEVAASAGTASLAAEVRHYLTQTPRQLPSRALYDTLGSALFDAICELPWYPITRAERRLIAGQRGAILLAAGWPERLIELGPGNGEKLDLLLGPADDPTAGLPRRSAHGSSNAEAGLRHVDLIDVSRSALATAARLITEGRNVTVATHQARYEEGLAHVAAARASDQRVMVLFLGSNIGNFDPPGAAAFLRSIRAALQPGDTLLIGADLVKSERDLGLAYDDPLGVTAAFNKNMLVHLNRELHATFDVARFDHRAVWNTSHSRVEMHLVSRTAQRVDLPKADLSIELAAGETIWTESSYKYVVEQFEEMLRGAGLAPAERWIDRDGQFLLVLARA